MERETEGDLILADMGEGIPFKAGCFDGAVSVSALQWLFNADKKSHNPVKRLNIFFTTLYASLVGVSIVYTNFNLMSIFFNLIMCPIQYFCFIK